VCAAGVVETGEDLYEKDPQLDYRNFVSRLGHPEIGQYGAPRPPFILSKIRCEVKRAPLLGEHTERALKTVLSMSDDEIAELVVQGVIE